MSKDGLHSVDLFEVDCNGTPTSIEQRPRRICGVTPFDTVSTAEALLNSLTLPISAPSLGGVESLITRPVKTSHANC